MAGPEDSRLSLAHRALDSEAGLAENNPTGTMYTTTLSVCTLNSKGKAKCPSDVEGKSGEGKSKG